MYEISYSDRTHGGDHLPGPSRFRLSGDLRSIRVKPDWTDAKSESHRMTALL